MSETIKSLSIPSAEIIELPTRHVIFIIRVQAAVRSWSIKRRYSEFYHLHQQLLKLSPQSQPPYPLPPKTYLNFGKFSDDFIEERRSCLEKYLFHILTSSDDCWRSSPVWCEFLEIPSMKSTENFTEFNSQSWLDEYRALHSVIREVRGLLVRRDSSLAKNEISISHQSTSQAKRLLINLAKRTSNLEVGLKSLDKNVGILSGGELIRRQDMLRELQDERNALSKLVHDGPHHLSNQSEDLLISSLSNKQSRSLETHSITRKPSLQSNRVFGRNATTVALENDITRPLDNRGLVDLQQEMMKRQDKNLDELLPIIRRQRELGTSIGQEIAVQNEMLDDISHDLTRTESKLANARKQLNRIR